MYKIVIVNSSRIAASGYIHIDFIGFGIFAVVRYKLISFAQLVVSSFSISLSTHPMGSYLNLFDIFFIVHKKTNNVDGWKNGEK